MATYKCAIKDFPYPYFIAACLHQTDPEKLVISNQLGIRTPEFIQFCKQTFEVFSQNDTYSKDAVERFFGLKFCELRLVKSQIRSFESRAMFGSQVVYIHKRCYLNKIFS